MTDRAIATIGSIVALLIALTGGMAVTGLSDGLYTATLAIATAGLLMLGALPWRQWSAIDIAYTAVVAFDVASAAWSPCRDAAISSSLASIVIWAMYVLLRRLLTDSRASAIIINGYTIITLIASAIAIGTFAVCAINARKAGLSDMYPLRYLYRPLGNPNNCWGETALLLTATACLCRSRWRIAAIFMGSVAALLTFSRGVYVATAVFSVALMALYRPTRSLRQILATIVVAAITVAALYPSEVLTTISLNKTTSQQASIEWRRDVSTTALKRFGERPATGHGNASFTLITDDTVANDGYTDTPPNIGVHILIEKGATGGVLWLILAGATALYVVRHRRRQQVAITGAALAALLVKEMTQSILAVAPTIALLAATLLAYMQRDTTDVKQPLRWRWSTRVVGILATLLLIGGDGLRTWFKADNSLLKEALEHVAHHRPDSAAMILERIIPAYCYDNRVKTILTHQYTATGQYDKAEALAAELPPDAFTIAAKAQTAYAGGDTVTATGRWAEAIMAAPSLMTTREFENIVASDSLLTAGIMHIIDRDIHTATPVEKAAYGYILHHRGDSSEATKWLTEAVAENPALRTPWILLGDTAKYDFLRRGGVTSGSMSTTLTDGAQSISDKILDTYRDRCHAWYGIDIPLDR